MLSPYQYISYSFNRFFFITYNNNEKLILNLTTNATADASASRMDFKKSRRLKNVRDRHYCKEDHRIFEMITPMDAKNAVVVAAKEK